ncbi:MAG: protease Lon-related BREX system protein BrxL [Methanobrevibacter sp.]|nr:protease Lon-related BREX system protein BrxL [Candidatus Methanovirga meridionalis]
MDDLNSTETDTNLNYRLNKYFPGKIVRKDLTKKIKEGANVPIYVLEYLLGKYASGDIELQINEGLETVKKILADNFVRPDEAEKIKSKIKEYGTYTVIDKVSVKLNVHTDIYSAEFVNLGISNMKIDEKYPHLYEKLLGGSIWCMVTFNYNPFSIEKLFPIQMPNLDLNEILDGRDHFTKDEWIDILLRFCGMEPTQLDERVKWLILARLVPLIENNFNLCELGPRNTGKSHIYKEISPNSILVSGGQTTVANLFYNMSTKMIGLVGMWDCVAFDEVAGIKFKDNDGVAIMKDYMASGSFSRGKDEKNAHASMVFVGNINQSPETLLKTSSLFDPFPDEIRTDSAFFDRMHCYIPGWEIPKFKPEHFTDDYGFITDYLAEFMREMRKRSFANSFDEFFKLGNNLNQRDVTAVRKMVSGLNKLIYPNGKYNKEDIREILIFALESRRRVKEQLKKIGGMEFYDVNFSYIDNETLKEEFVRVKEQISGKLIPNGLSKPGHLYTAGIVSNDQIGIFKLETETTKGNGKFQKTGLDSKQVKEAVETAFNYFKSNASNISKSINPKTNDYLMDIQDLNGIGITKSLALPVFVALCSVTLNKPIISSAVILGSLTIGGTLIKIDNLAAVLQTCLDNGAKKVLLPASSTIDLSSVPTEVLGKFNLIFYTSPEDAVFKALGVD